MASFDPITAALEIGNSLVKRVIPDPAEQARHMLEMAKLAQEGDIDKLQMKVSLLLGQIEVNKAEAQSPHWFIASWRPATGWICAIGLAYAAIVEPLMRFVATVIFKYTGTFPALDTDLTLQVLLGMLGLAVMRTTEKHAGVPSSMLKKKSSADISAVAQIPDDLEPEIAGVKRTLGEIVAKYKK